MDIMIDIETLGTSTKCPVISIGAVAFDLTKVVGTYYNSLDVSEQIDSGKRVVDASTIKWWMQQSGSAKKVFKETAVPTNKVLEELSQFVKSFDSSKDHPYVWGNGATFDISILESLYKDYNCTVPWKYNKIMDMRTVKRFLGKDVELLRKGTFHNALDDAVTQAEFIQKCIKKLYK